MKEWKRIGNTLVRKKLILCNFSLRYTPKIAMENIFVIGYLKKKREEKHLPRDTEKADSQALGSTSGMRISGILHFEHVPLGISADSKL